MAQAYDRIGFAGCRRRLFVPELSPPDGRGQPIILLVSMGLLLFVLVGYLSQHPLPVSAAVSDSPGIVGRLVDPQGEAVRNAEVVVYLDGGEQSVAAEESQADGSFTLDLPSGPIESLRVDIARPHFQSTTWTAGPDELALLRQGATVRLADITLERRITPGFWIATLTFVSVLLLIALERLHNTMAALLGAFIILGVSFVGRPLNPDLFIFDFEQALQYVDFDVIFLVLGMMIVVGILETTGIFQWMAYQAYRLSRGRAWLLVIILMLLTAVASAMLDNVTTMLLMVPITLEIALALGINPRSLILPEVMASNIGGISTLIGTPTNILIGSYADIGFSDFLINLTPGVLMALAALTVYVLVVYRHEYRAAALELSPALLERLKEDGRITRPKTLGKAGAIFILMLVVFVAGEQIHLVAAVTAMLGAVFMLLVVEPDIDEMLKVVDWTTLMFFIALFMVIGAIQEVGLISIIAVGIKRLVGDNLNLALLVIVWAGAFMSGLIDNIPFTAAMLPVVGFLSKTIPGASNKALFYGLSVGAAMGGNSTLIGASANMVTAGITERAGYRISYMRFLKIGLPATIITVAMGTIWLLIRF
ncbi:MAG: citrate transporter [Chloroflexi bacterium B3_Chlor]|nr:MAG: citrate transporter [Chloroflexi bacterium B3_Chlor]